MLIGAANRLVRALLAPTCAACRSGLDCPLDGPVCDQCWAAVPRFTPPVCLVCGIPQPPAPASLCAHCEADAPPYACARSVGPHAGSLRAIVHALKYDGRRTLAGPLGALMRDAGAGMLAAADVVVPVPQHPWRTLTRGFNQADDLAQQLGLPVCHALRRVRYGPPQAGLGAQARRDSVREAFGRRWHAPVAWRRPGSQLRGRRVVLVDDVMTTGATVEGCTRVLLEAGVAAVSVLTVARAPVPPPGTLLRARHPSTVQRR